MLRLVITLPFLILLVVFVLFNQTPGTMELPYLSWQSSVGVVALITAVVFFLVGALAVWFAELRQRRRARRAEQQVRTLETQIADLRAQLSQSVAQNVAYQGTIPPHGAVPAQVPGYPPAAY